MDLKEKYLTKIKEEKIFVDICCDHYEETDFGFIIDFNDEFLFLETFDTNSNPDGLVIFFQKNISRIRWEGNEISSAAHLIDHSKRIQSIATIDLSSVENILRDLSAMYGYVTVHIQDLDQGVCFIGEIHEMDEDTIILYEFGSKISLDRKFIMISLDDITRIEVGGMYENGLKRLIEEKIIK
ncbi:MAG: hypothetical protein H7Y04_03180 [Verrucomicrobia bacterium]|nr:hypothetical protein [Cytophagales bacterium]